MGRGLPQVDVPGDWSDRLAASLAHRQRDRRVRGIVVTDPFRAPLSPRLAYGRHRGPARLGSRRAAVLIALYSNAQTGQLCLTLTRRPMSLSHHGGQICLPGGRIESGESALDAALREYREELGVPLRGVRPLGSLAPIYVFASDNWVQTLVAAADSPDQPWRPDPSEVDQVIEMPIRAISAIPQVASSGVNVAGGPGRPAATERRDAPVSIAARAAERTVREAAGGGASGYRFGYPEVRFVDCHGKRRSLWGATAMLLAEFAGIWNRTV